MPRQEYPPAFNAANKLASKFAETTLPMPLSTTR